MAGKHKLTTGLNDRPVDETIAQSGAGLPDDTTRSRGVKGDEAGVSTGAAGNETDNPEMVPDGTPNAGENICRRCVGTGAVNGAPCPDCGGSGKVTTPIGGA